MVLVFSCSPAGLSQRLGSITCCVARDLITRLLWALLMLKERFRFVKVGLGGTNDAGVVAEWTVKIRDELVEVD